MDPFTSYIISVVCCILMITESGVHGKLVKPILEIETEDPYDVYMIGSTVYLNCTNSLNAKKFYWIKNGNKETIKEQTNHIFAITNLNTTDSGYYTCQYFSNSEYSEHSESMYLYVRDQYPPPTITVEPKAIVQPGEDITIICNSLYPDVAFTLYKGRVVVEETENNPLTYVIHNTHKEHAGRYSCRYSKLQMQSSFSYTLMIDVKALPRPEIAWEVYQEGKMKISCIAPEQSKRMWFQLFNESKDVIDEIKAVKENQVDFEVPHRKQPLLKYYCMYRIRMGNMFADSIVSDAAIIGEESFTPQDYLLGNIIRLFLSAIILIILMIIVVKHFRRSQRHKRLPPKLPAPRKKLAVDSEYTQMVVLKTEDNTKEKTEECTAQTGYSEESCANKTNEMVFKKTEGDTEENTKALRTDREESCHAKEEKEVLQMKNSDALKESLLPTLPTRAVSAVVEKVNEQEELQTSN
ncbi:uncharacterized protein RB166_012399 isoform 2-T2 [Leptodactylus fuscus]|uniref:uncharacterized protein LOC142210780 isoform X2 n=1 Tax=Leptodactylus fuscus TaxID=238119 RepID=UPI003F4EC429